MNIWDGSIFNSFSEAKKYSSDNCYSTKEAIDSLNKQLGRENTFSTTVLPIYASVYTCPRILDFGGGFGSDVSLIYNKEFRYTIVERDFVIENLPNSIYFNRNVDFVSDYDYNKYDIVHLNSSLQYLENWKVALSRLKDKCSPDLFILNDILYSNNESFVTLQNFYGNKIPVRFFRISEIINLFTLLGYELVFSYNCKLKYFGKYQDVPMDNFSNEFRIKNTKGLVFKK